jgi:hypothetical protein
LVAVLVCPELVRAPLAVMFPWLSSTIDALFSSSQARQLLLQPGARNSEVDSARVEEIQKGHGQSVIHSRDPCDVSFWAARTAFTEAWILDFEVWWQDGTSRAPMRRPIVSQSRYEPIHKITH